MPRPKGSGNRSELVELAIAGIDAQIQQLQAQILALTDKRKQLAKPGTGTSAAVVSKTRKAAATVNTASTKKKRVVSAATRKKLKDAAKARWARERGEKNE